MPNPINPFVLSLKQDRIGNNASPNTQDIDDAIKLVTRIYDAVVATGKYPNMPKCRFVVNMERNLGEAEPIYGVYGSTTTDDNADIRPSFDWVPVLLEMLCLRCGKITTPHYIGRFGLDRAEVYINKDVRKAYSIRMDTRIPVATGSDRLLKYWQMLEENLRKGVVERPEEYPEEALISY